MGVKVREKPSNSGIWWIFIDHQGKRKAKKIGKDKKLAHQAAKKIEARLILGEFQIDGEKAEVPTLRQYVYGWTTTQGKSDLGWLHKYARLSLKASTW